ncbi:putative piggyBac transposable element-derived protein 4-like [Penaeus vannamei]|uniref:Putative piggyBac transposable element-derived protein 4-like n=1 Tax=Penaeus vannamei TaxID=6689 RepID=A0A3R7MKB3_PENVA|nr:putative piggyBac transposable element-derived protein 4-like [Penaeus vannamei]
MSRQLRTQRCRSSKYSHAVRNLYDSDPDDPRPSTSGEGPRRLRNAPESHFYLYETASGRGEMREALDSSAQPAKSGRSTAIPNIPDSDWDMDVDDSDDDADYSPEATESDADWEEFDYVSSHDTSIDSDEPLSAVARRFAMRNAPGTPGFVWKKKRPFVRRHPFQGVPGVEEACLLHADSTAREILDCFLTPELWDTMTRETNRYVEQRPVTPSSHMKTWENTTVEELQSFIGLRLLMGLQPRPHSRYYWSKNRLLSSSVFPETMTRDRFDLLQSRLHFSDNEDPRADTDRLWKLRPVLDILDTTFKTVYIPDRKIVVDESLWAFRGRHHAIQFNPTKRARFGMKVYRLCESDGAGAGYTSAFNVYMGQDRGDVPASMKAVTDLMNRACFFEKGYELYLDNWYSSPELFHYLSSRKTNAVGTVRLNRKFMPKDLKVSARGDVDFRTSATGMLAMSWMDRKPVHMLSTIHGPDMVDLPPNRRGIVRTKPQAVVDYNVGKKGVDLADQLAASYSTTRRTNKWYQNVFYHLLDMAAVNAFVVHRALGGTLTQLEFRLEIIANFLDQPPAYGRRGGLRTPPAATPSPPRRRNAPRQQQRQQVPQGHVLAFNPGRKYRRCRHCRVSRNVRKETRYRKIHDATSSGKRKIHDAASSSRRTPHAASSSRRISHSHAASSSRRTSHAASSSRMISHAANSSRRTSHAASSSRMISHAANSSRRTSHAATSSRRTSHAAMHQQWKGLSRRLQQQDDLSRRTSSRRTSHRHQQQKDLSRRLQQQDDLSRRHQQQKDLFLTPQQKDLSRATSSGRTSHAASSSRMISHDHQQQKDLLTPPPAAEGPLTPPPAVEGPLTLPPAAG